MKILVLADQRSKALYDYYEPQKLEGIDLILSCGDLEPHYLSFFATLWEAPWSIYPMLPINIRREP